MPCIRPCFIKWKKALDAEASYMYPQKNSQTQLCTVAYLWALFFFRLRDSSFPAVEFSIRFFHITVSFTRNSFRFEFQNLEKPRFIHLLAGRVSVWALSSFPSTL